MSDFKVPVRSMIDHIKGAMDVDPWAKEMLEQLVTEQPVVIRCKDCRYCYFASNRILCMQSLVCAKTGNDITPDWFCADGECKEGR